MAPLAFLLQEYERVVDFGIFVAIYFFNMVTAQNGRAVVYDGMIMIAIGFTDGFLFSVQCNCRADVY